MNRIRFFAVTIFSLAALANNAFAQSASEVHAVGVYQGATPQSSAYRAAVNRLLKQCDRDPSCDWSGGWKRINERFPSKATVKVSRVGAPVILVLSAYSRTEWRVEYAPGVKIQKIIMSGYERQTLKKTPAIRGVSVSRSYYGKPSVNREDYFYFFQDDRDKPVSNTVIKDGAQVCAEPNDPSEIPAHESDFQNAIDYLSGIKLTPTSVQGKYEAGRFRITNKTKGNSLSKVRLSKHCYRNSDGTLSPGSE